MKLRKLLLTFLTFVLLFSLPAYAHSGGTDGAGGHYDRFSGEYHYHHGYSAHQHPDGVCPYRDDDQTEYAHKENDNEKIEEISVFWCVVFGLLSGFISVIMLSSVIGFFLSFINKSWSERFWWIIYVILFIISSTICVTICLADAGHI